MFDPDKIEDLQFSTEKQIMDRKSARIRAVDLAVPVVDMANADGGYLAIGIEDDGTITGIDEHEKNVNELLRVPYDYCFPNVQIDIKTTTMNYKIAKLIISTLSFGIVHESSILCYSVN